MPFSRRSFLHKFGAGAAAATAVVASPQLFAANEPRRIPVAGGPILLNSNENAYGAFPSVAAQMRDALAVSNRYPFLQADALAERIAKYHNVDVKQVLVGDGSNEMLLAAADAFTGPDRALVQATPTFEALARYAERRKAQVIQIPLTGDYAHDLDAMLPKASGAGLVYICNPNNPTASLTPAAKIDAFLAKLSPSTRVVIDEAYYHFAIGAPDYKSYLGSGTDRVIVLRTFSKVYGMAGLRLGYAISTPENIEQMRRYTLMDNINMIAALCGMVALDDDDAMHAAAQRNAADRQEFLHQAQTRGLRVIPSSANFAMFECGQPTKDVIEYFKRNNIAVGRPFPPMNTCLRVSFGKPEEMQTFWRTWDKLPRGASNA